MKECAGLMVVQSSSHLNGKELLNRIENARNEMNDLAVNFGVTHHLTVAKSQEFDVIMNEYMLHTMFR